MSPSLERQRERESDSLKMKRYIFESETGYFAWGMGKGSEREKIKRREKTEQQQQNKTGTTLHATYNSSYIIMSVFDSSGRLLRLDKRSILPVMLVEYLGTFCDFSFSNYNAIS